MTSLPINENAPKSTLADPDKLLLPVFRQRKIIDRAAHKRKVESAHKPFAHVPFDEV